MASEPSEWAVTAARRIYLFGECRCDAGGICELHRDIAEAIAVSEERGHTRAVNETAIASIHKAVAAERAAVVAWLWTQSKLTVQRGGGHFASFESAAINIEAGDHHPKEQA